MGQFGYINMIPILECAEHLKHSMQTPLQRQTSLHKKAELPALEEGTCGPGNTKQDSYMNGQLNTSICPVGSHIG